MALTRLFALLALLSAVPAGAQNRYDPALRFHTISTARFDIHFHQGEAEEARRLAGFVEEVAAEVDAAIGPAAGRVQVILVAQDDLPNGWATPLPYNTIELTATAPAASSLIGNTDDWLRLVFAHEYVHIAHLSRSGGWIGALRKPFGRLPVLFPNLFQPLWGIEGIATWQESAVTGGGRVRAGDFRLLIGEAAQAGRFEPIDRANGGNVDWPSGSIPYLYGGYFHRFLADAYGDDAMRRLADETARRLPYFGSRAYRKVFGRPLGQLWKQFEASWQERARSADAATASRATRLTFHGFRVSGPRHGGDDRVYYAAISPHHFPALMTVPSRGGAARLVTDRYLGSRIAVLGSRLLYDEIDRVRNVGLQADLYLFDTVTGERRRLTRQARAQDPDVTASGRVVCTLQSADRRGLATFELPATPGIVRPEPLVSEPGVHFAAPAWSPDGSTIAAERRAVGGASEIVLVDPVRRRVRVLASLPGGRSTSPVWTPDGAYVVFAAAVGDASFQIHRADVRSGAIARLEGAGASAEFPDISPDGRTIVYVGYTPDGHDLFAMSLEQASWTAVAAGAPAPEPLQPAAGAGLPASASDYSPWATLRPTFWTPTVESDADEIVVGAATAGVDALARHAYAIEAGWSTRGRPDWQAAYAYDRWWPTVFVSAADDTDPFSQGELRTVEATAGVLLRSRRVRRSHSTLAAFHVARDTFDCPACAPAAAGRARRASVRLGWVYASARTFGYSISAEQGGLFAITAEVPRTAIGADGDGVALTADVRRYVEVWPRHGVLAVRAAAAGFWGDEAAERRFSAGGHGPQPAGFGFGLDAIGLLRGFGEDEAVGTRAAVVNADYRVPLARVDRGLGTIPLFVRSIHGALFVDAGHAWRASPRWRQARLSLGAELSTDIVAGFVLPMTLTAGGAWTRDGATGERGFVAFGRVGRAF